MKPIDLSIIVACYNIQDYVKACLKSLVQTRFPQNNMEVLMVDDGSTDRTSQIIDQFDQKYPQFHALHKHNGGLSQARNYGMDRAHGKYIAFVDGDDIVPPDAYTNLVYTAETHHSQIVVGFVKRFHKNKWGSFLHKHSVGNNIFNTDLDHTPRLLYDTTAWNKLYLASFLKKHHFRFIPGILYEDLPFVLNVFLHSHRISYIKNVVYGWRKRSQSITQNRGAISNFKSRIASLNRCRNELLRAGYTPKDALFIIFEKKVLGLDLQIFLNNVGDTSNDYLYNFQEIIYRFLRNWHLLYSPLLHQLPVKTQLLYYAIKTGNFLLLRKLAYVWNHNIGDLKYNHWNRHYDFELRNLPQNLLKHVNVKDNVLTTSQTLKNLGVNHKRHLIYGSGKFRIQNIQLFKRHFHNDDQREHISAKLVNINNHETMPIQFTREKTTAYKRIFHPPNLVD